MLEFVSNGLPYQALTRDGLTVMYARMPLSIRDFGVLQVAVANGSDEIWKLQTADFIFEPEGGSPIPAASESEVINDLFQNAGPSEVVKLRTTYERALFGSRADRPRNDYEQRRLSALSLGDKGVKAAAAAAAMVFASTRLSPGESTDGAVFFASGGKALGPGRLVARVEGRVFEFRSR